MLEEQLQKVDCMWTYIDTSVCTLTSVRAQFRTEAQELGNSKIKTGDRPKTSKLKTQRHMQRATCVSRSRHRQSVWRSRARLQTRGVFGTVILRPSPVDFPARRVPGLVRNGRLSSTTGRRKRVRPRARAYIPNVTPVRRAVAHTEARPMPGLHPLLLRSTHRRGQTIPRRPRPPKKPNHPTHQPVRPLVRLHPLPEDPRRHQDPRAGPPVHTFPEHGEAASRGHVEMGEISVATEAIQ